MPAFEVIRVPFSHYAVHNAIIGRLPSTPPRQSGAVLKDVPELQIIFAQLTAMVSGHFNRRMYLRLDKSSYRLQTPDGEGALPLHQDYIPLTDPVTSRFHFNGGIKKFLVGLKEGLPKLTDPATEPCCTVWLPLCEIDGATPTLEVCPLPPPKFIKHKTDAAGYAVLSSPADFDYLPMCEITQMPFGYGVMFGPLTLHRSCVRSTHTKERRSMDLRFLPRPMRGS